MKGEREMGEGVMGVEWGVMGVRWQGEKYFKEKGRKKIMSGFRRRESNEGREKWVTGRNGW